MAVALGDLGKFDEALAILKEVMDKDASILETYDSLGYIYYKKGDFKAAEKEYKKILELDPKNAKAKNSLEILKREINVKS
jgi:tetratricopeptide (TPR) repeat protein